MRDGLRGPAGEGLSPRAGALPARLPRLLSVKPSLSRLVPEGRPQAGSAPGCAGQFLDPEIRNATQHGVRKKAVQDIGKFWENMTQEGEEINPRSLRVRFSTAPPLSWCHLLFCC